MWRVWKSVRSYRQDPEWRYRKRESREWVKAFGPPAHPFGKRGNHVKHVLEGRVRGYETTFFHLAAVHEGGRHPSDVSRYSVAVLPLPGALPATEVSVASLVRWLGTEPLPPRAGIAVHLLPGRKPRMVACSVDPDFAGLILTERVVRMTADAKMGWRLHGDHMIGWIKEHKPYQRIIGLAEVMADIVGEFPVSVWSRDSAEQEHY
ncbi:hypothetical protein HXP44_17260 [Streptomyces sioyaensis]|uniref:Uncharacterized protein n=1 Tax=Streptomyces sioyaensis TaxID=67364 RepID=A0A4Q1RBR7_9ACTN|nr:hypothetical protein [Streptomyces sioyaensis]MBM4793768.1 hypothetical protein [Streptomyces sioyaensis]RXS70902.1 hypothetical protein EST54_01895 [Streptomyces sioyaensis]